MIGKNFALVEIISLNSGTTEPRDLLHFHYLTTEKLFLDAHNIIGYKCFVEASFVAP